MSSPFSRTNVIVPISLVAQDLQIIMALSSASSQRLDAAAMDELQSQHAEDSQMTALIAEFSASPATSQLVVMPDDEPERQNRLPGTPNGLDLQPTGLQVDADVMLADGVRVVADAMPVVMLAMPASPVDTDNDIVEGDNPDSACGTEPTDSCDDQGPTSGDGDGLVGGEDLSDTKIVDGCMDEEVVERCAVETGMSASIVRKVLRAERKVAANIVLAGGKFNAAGLVKIKIKLSDEPANRHVKRASLSKTKSLKRVVVRANDDDSAVPSPTVSESD
jgi:hypothetical protein